MLPRRTRHILWAFSALLLLGIVFILFRPQNPNDIHYKGKRLSDHIRIGYSPRTVVTNLNISNSRSAVAELGTNCLPLLAELLRSETPAWRVKLGERLWKHGFRIHLFPPVEEAASASWAMMHLGPKALPLLPMLAINATNSNPRVANVAVQTLLTLTLMQRENLPPAVDLALREPLARAIANFEAQSRQGTNTFALVSLRNVERRLGIKIPSEVLAIAITDPQLSLESRVKHLRTLSRRGEHYSTAEPILLEHIKSPDTNIAENAAISLKNYGPKATRALPHLTNALSHPAPSVRTAASNAITRISAR